jgi:hypothetical protein
MQLERELSANKCKEMQVKSLAFPFIPFAEFGLFNGLQAIQIKKSASAPTRVPGCELEPLKRIAKLRPPYRQTANGQDLVLQIRRHITLISVLGKLLQPCSETLRPDRSSSTLASRTRLTGPRERRRLGDDELFAVPKRARGRHMPQAVIRVN